MKRYFHFLVLTAFLMGIPSSVSADTNADMMAMLQSMKQQMAQMQSTIEQQNIRIQQLEASRPAETARPKESKGAASQPMLTETDWQNNIKENIGAAVPWLKGVKFGGDFRLRYEAFQYSDRNNENGSTTTAADRDRNRFRIRLRWGFEKDYGDDWKVGFRLATGPNSATGQPQDNTSSNQTLGNAGYFNFKSINIDRAYAAYSPSALKDVGPLKSVTIGAGKFENPFLRYATTIVWDADVTPEGIYEKAHLELVNTEETKVNFYATTGQFIVNENSGFNQDAELYGYQGALNVSTYGFGTAMPIDLTGAVSFYDYNNWSGTVANNTSGASYLRTNTLAADNFRVLDLYPELQFYLDRTPVTLWYNYVQNLGNEGTDNARGLTNPIHDDDTAWGLGMKVGKARKKGEWEASYGYYSIEANAVVAAFNDGDFGGPGTNGFTNRKGHKFGFTYKLTDAIDVNWTGYIVEPEDPSNIVANSTNETVFRSQADVVYKF